MRNWSERVLNEFAYFMIGEEIGSGMSRKVFIHPHDSTKVIKVENSTVHFQNVREWEFWSQNKFNDKIAKWLAPCYYISDSGTFLIMERTTPLRKNETPEMLPSFLTDLKRANFGMIGKRVVCHDYGTLFFNPSMKLRKARFNDD